MAEQDFTGKPSQTVSWQQFNQTPLNPQSGENPVTRVINMVLGPDKSVRTRSGFKAIDTADASKVLKYPDTAITTHLVNADQDSTLVLMGGNDNKTTDNGVLAYFDEKNNKIQPVQSAAYNGLNYFDPVANTPGYFSSYGGEIYFCQSEGDKDTLFAWDGGSKFRNVGVAPMTGDYTGQMCRHRQYRELCS